MSAGGSRSSTNAASQSFIDPTQAAHLTQLWGSAAQNANPQQAGQAAAAAAQPGQRATLTAMQGLSRMAANPNAGQGGVLARLGELGNVNRATQASAPALRTLKGLMDPSAQVAAQSRSLKTGLSNLFAEELNPAIRGNAIAAGGFGGGRQGVAQGQAVGQIADSYREGLGDIVAGANAQAAGAAGGYADIMSNIRSGALSATGARADVISGGRGQALQASSMIPMLGSAAQGFGTAGSDARIAALQALASVYGNPTVLSQAASGSNAGGFNFGFI